MNSRETILKALALNKPQKTDLPEIPDFNIGRQDLKGQYKASLLSNKGSFYEGYDVLEFYHKMISTFFQEAIICSLVPEIKGNFDVSSVQYPHELANVDLAILKSDLGVAENAALWLTEQQIGHRVLPFITQHLVVIMEEKNLVADMHEAYKIIGINNDGYGVFVAGPSKTADIEQSLVIGAHGARSLSVFLKSS